MSQSATIFYVWKYDPMGGEEENPGAILDITTPIPKALSDDSLETHATVFDTQARCVVQALKALPQGVLVRVAIYLMQDYCKNVAGHFHISGKKEEAGGR
jgi:hypothetical protein